MRICARAPLRVSYAGGGTDVPPYPQLVGGVVLSSTIKSYAYCTLTPRTDKRVSIFHENTGRNEKLASLADVGGDHEDALVSAVAHRFSLEDGFDVSLRYDALPGAGLGSSSALCVSVIGALKEWQKNSMTIYDVANLAYEVERKDVGIPGGMQDQYASAFGGFNLIEFRKDATIVNPLRVGREVLHELEYNSILCFTGKTRQSGGILKRQIESYERKDSAVLGSLEKMKELTLEMKDMLMTGDLPEFAKLLNAEWELKKKLDRAISTDESEKLLAAARNSGAIGGKLLGAGGGGFLFLYCESGKQARVQQELEQLGGHVSPVRFDKEGLQTWRSPN